MFIKILVCLIIGYAFGCISTAYVVGKVNRIDIRNFGSGNAGTTNALRTLGWKAGAVTFIGDAFKAVIAILLIRYLIFPNEDYAQLFKLYTGVGVVLGHNFPFWLKFKGGKGIAATGGIMLAFDWRLAIAAMIVFMITVAISRYVSLGSMLISVLLPVWIAILYPGDVHMLLVGIAFTISAFIKHRTNIRRLIKGTENKIGQKVTIKKQ